MKIGITGGTGFLGRHLARALVNQGHQAVLFARGADERDLSVRNLENAEFVSASVTDQSHLEQAFEGCDAIAHLAGINREIGKQTYQRVHVEGTKNVVNAAESTSVEKLVFISFLRARPNCNSDYHKSKWQGEKIVRNGDVDYTILKPGVTYGLGDHMLDHLTKSISTFPVFGLIGFQPRRLKPLAVQDLVKIMKASLVEKRLSEKTVPVVGPEQVTIKQAVQRIGDVLGRCPFFIPLPVFVHYFLAWIQEWMMEIPITASAQVKMLAEEIVDPAPEDVCDPCPEDLRPTTMFSKKQIEQGLPEEKTFGLTDLRRLKS